MTLVCVAVVAVTIAAVFFPSIRSTVGLNPVSAPGYRAGDRIDLPTGAYDDSTLTVLVFVRSNCPACRRSQPMFKDIADRLGGTPARMRLVIDHARAEAETEYATALGLASTALIPADFLALHLHVVPTLVLVDRSGEVLYALEGVPSDEQRDDLLRLVRAGGHAG